MQRHTAIKQRHCQQWCRLTVATQMLSGLHCFKHDVSHAVACSQQASAGATAANGKAATKALKQHIHGQCACQDSCDHGKSP